MVCGESGVGKSTFIEHLIFKLSKDGHAKFERRKKLKPDYKPSDGIFGQTETKKIATFKFKTDDLTIQLIDTPGHGS